MDALTPNAATPPLDPVAYYFNGNEQRTVPVAIERHGNRKPGKQATAKAFKQACVRVRDNLPAGESGFVWDIDGTLHRVGRDTKTAKPVNDPQTRERIIGGIVRAMERMQRQAADALDAYNSNGYDRLAADVLNADPIKA